MALVFSRAVVRCNRIYDVANEIDLVEAERLLAQGSRRLKLSREGAEYLQLPNPPLSVALGKRTLPLKDGPHEVEAIARLFDHGALSIQLEIPVRKGSSRAEVAARVDEVDDSQAVETLSLELANGLRTVLDNAFEGPHLWEQNESYTVIFATELEGAPTAEALLAEVDLAALLLGERGGPKLSERERAEVLQHAFSYTEMDLAVIDWNSAFVYEPSGSTDILDVLEICNAQLLELRYYDELLDGHIRAAHDAMARRAHPRAIWASSYRPLARRVLAILLEMSELIERLENSLKIIGDFYLAKVYEAAMQRLRVNAWRVTVTRKQHVLEQVYELIKDEVDATRSLTLEATVIFLIVAETIVAIASLWH